MNLNEIYDIKMSKKKLYTLFRSECIFTVYFLKYILRVKVRIYFFLNEISILVFAELAIFHCI